MLKPAVTKTDNAESQLSAFVQNCAGTGKVSEQRGIGGTV